MWIHTKKQKKQKTKKKQTKKMIMVTVGELPSFVLYYGKDVKLLLHVLP